MLKYYQRKQYKINVFYIYVLELVKGGYVWVSAGKDKGNWIQCTKCGHIYFVEEEVPIDRLYVASVCARCGEYGNNLNCGDKEEDIVIYADPILDERYYMY